MRALLWLTNSLVCCAPLIGLTRQLRVLMSSLLRFMGTLHVLMRSLLGLMQPFLGLMSLALWFRGGPLAWVYTSRHGEMSSLLDCVLWSAWYVLAWIVDPARVGASIARVQSVPCSR